jgi:BirA family transcriptional regulator, biotin operon repressor / biotin---[acetyl-CoA-carboxylase] ligase
MFDLAALDRELAGTLFAGKIHFTAVTESTNSDALAAARLGAPHGSVFLADEQTAGRGRGGHGWHSAAGEGLYVSVLLRLALPAARLQLLPLSAGLAAAEAIHSASGLTVDLRWPNDLLLGPAKVGGILVEAGKNSAKNESKALHHAVLGIGVNVHQRSFPSGLATPATSLDLTAARTVSRQPLLLALLQSLEREISTLAADGAAAALAARLEAGSTWIRGRRVEVHGPQACTGVTAGLDEHGFLRVETASGVVTVQTGGIRQKD